MKYPRVLIVIAAMLLMLSAVSASTRGSDLEVVLLNYEPVPARPGNTIDVWLQVQNTGNEASTSATLTFRDSYPFSVSLASDKEKSIPSIPARESFLVKAQIRIDKDAHEGENLMQVRLVEAGEEGANDFDIPITIRGRTSALSVASATTTPQSIMPGGEADLALVLENVGQTKISNLDVSLDLTGLSLTPISGSNSKTISDLRSSASHTFMFTLRAAPSAAVGTYQLPVTFTYEDEQGNSLSQTETIGLVISSDPELLVYFENVDIYKEQKQGDVTIRFVNKGLSEIKLLQMQVMENDNVKVISESDVVYVGNIDEDDYESAEITLKVSADAVDIPLRIQYRDTFNTPFSEDRIIHLDLVSLGENSKSGSSTWLWIVVIVVVGGGIWYWRKRKHSRGKKK